MGSPPSSSPAPQPVGVIGRRRAAAAAALLFALALGMRLPFLGAGYGYDLDAWTAAWVGRQIAESGEYLASRPPGFPVQEYAFALLWRGGPLALNGLTALWSALAPLIKISGPTIALNDPRRPP